MKMKLSPVWFLEKPCDFEHKQYILLAYLQKVEAGFAVGNLADFLAEARYHTKNLECFLSIRSILEMKTIPSPTEEQRDQFTIIASLPDDDPRLMEVMKIAKWAVKKLQDVVKKGAELWKKVESNLNVYFIGKNVVDKNTGFLLVRYAGSTVFESYRYLFNPKTRETTFSLHAYHDMPTKADFGDVKLKILKDEGLHDDIFIAVESLTSYDTKKTVFPVINFIFSSKIYNKPILKLGF